MNSKVDTKLKNKQIKLLDTGQRNETVATVLSQNKRKKYIPSPEAREHHRQRGIEYRKRPEVKEHLTQYNREYNQRPEIKELHRINIKKWRKANPEKYKQHLEYVKQWKQDNKERVRQRNRDYYHADIEKWREYSRTYYQNNKERISEKTKSGRKTTNSRSKMTPK
jgi:hypothetical protein